MSQEPTPEEVEPAHPMFDLGRQGMVERLLAPGADPDVGTPTARETAAVCGRSLET
jgi:hypothetical protein